LPTHIGFAGSAEQAGHGDLDRVECAGDAVAQLSARAVTVLALDVREQHPPVRPRGDQPRHQPRRDAVDQADRGRLVGEERRHLLEPHVVAEAPDRRQVPRALLAGHDRPAQHLPRPGERRRRPTDLGASPTSCHQGSDTSNGGSAPSTRPPGSTRTSVTVRLTTETVTSGG
jgi:hypothetical protein